MHHTQVVLVIACLMVLGAYTGGGGRIAHTPSLQSDIVSSDTIHTRDDLWWHEHTVLVTIDGHTYRGTLTLIGEE